jgi:3-hydroxymyristoyl/3-hydroxydecanoyl-(acyl carrier protein) dehydratase
VSALEATVRVPCDHPAFEGHFPAHPVLPGVVLLGEALARIAAASHARPESFALVQCKFLKPVSPGASLTFSCGDTDEPTVRFEFRDGTEAVTSGAFSRNVP